MKNRDKFGTADFIEAAMKLMQGLSEVGQLERCNQYWGRGTSSVKNQSKFCKELQVCPTLGKAYLVSRLGRNTTVAIRRDTWAKGRLILLQVPDSSLYEIPHEKHLQLQEVD